VLVWELTFKLSDFTGIKHKKSTKNKEFYFLVIPVIFIRPLRLKLIYIHKNKVYIACSFKFYKRNKKPGTLWYCDILWYTYYCTRMKNKYWKFPCLSCCTHWSCGYTIHTCHPFVLSPRPYRQFQFMRAGRKASYMYRYHIADDYAEKIKILVV
jgi:hypothetical protein